MRSRNNSCNYSIDLDLVNKDKQRLARLVKELGIVSAGAIEKIPGNDYSINVLGPGFMGAKYSSQNAPHIAGELNAALQANLIKHFDVVNVEVGLIVDPHNETLALGLSSESPFNIFRLQTVAAMQGILKAMGASKVSKLSSKEMAEVFTGNGVQPRIDIAHYRPNILGLDPIDEIIDLSYSDVIGISSGSKSLLNLIPSTVAVKGLRLAKTYDRSTPLQGHEEHLEGNFDDDNRLLRRWDDYAYES